MTVKNPMKNQDEREDQPVDDHEEQQEGPTPTANTVMASDRVNNSHDSFLIISFHLLSSAFIIYIFNHICILFLFIFIHVFSPIK